MFLAQYKALAQVFGLTTLTLSDFLRRRRHSLGRRRDQDCTALTDGGYFLRTLSRKSKERCSGKGRRKCVIEYEYNIKILYLIFFSVDIKHL